MRFRNVGVVVVVALGVACAGDSPAVTPAVTPPAIASPPAAVDAAAAAVASEVDASPAVDARPAAPADLVDVALLIPDAVIDMRYAGADNFTHTVLYPVARCLLRRSVADRLVLAAAALRDKGRRLLLWDCYRPASIQKLLWERVKDPRYVAKPVFDANGAPVSGSRHSRGAAIDVGLVAADGSAVVLPTAHDDFSVAAHRKRAKKGKGRAALAVLDAALVGAGFVGMPTEWWHYDAEDAMSFPLSDEPLARP